MSIDRLSIYAPLDEPTILELPTSYRTAIDRNLLGLLKGRLIYYESIPTITKHICRIIVPTSLCYVIFSLIHTTHFSGHMREYKTVYRIGIRLQLCWSRLCSNISDWIEKCPHCMLAYRWMCRGQELTFS